MKVIFVLSIADQKLASRTIYKLLPKTSLMRIINFCGSCFGAFLATVGTLPLIRILYERGSDVAEITFCLGVIVLGVLLLIARKLIVSSMALKLSGIFGSTYSYEALEDRIVSIKNSNIRTEIYPSAILKIITTASFVFIYTGDAYAYFIPSTAFSTSSEQSEFVKKLEQIKQSTANNGVDSVTSNTSEQVTEETVVHK